MADESGRARRFVRTSLLTRTSVATLGALTLAACTVDDGRVPLPDLSGAEADVARAVREDRAGVRAESGSAAAWGRYANRLRYHGWPEEAVACYDEAAALAPGEFGWRYGAGLTLIGVDPERAAVRLEEAIAIDPGYAPARVHYGGVLMKLGRAGEAREQFARALVLDRKSVHAALGLGQIALLEGDTEEALAHLGHAVNERPEFAEAHLALAQALMAVGNEDLARRHADLGRAAPRDMPVRDPRAPPPPEPAGVKGHLDAATRAEQRGQADEAIAHYRAVLENDPDLSVVHFKLGRLLVDLGRHEEAAASLADAARLNPSDAATHVTLSYVYNELGRPGEAARSLQEAARLKPQDAATRLRLGMHLLRHGRADRALVQLREADRLRPDHRETRVNLALALAATGSEAEAIAILRRDVEDVPNDPDVRLALSDVCAAAERTDCAREAARKAIEIATAAGRPALADAARRRLERLAPPKDAP